MIANVFDPNTLARTYREPVAWAILAVDLFPVIAVLTMGWGTATLVFLYWLENLIIGAAALARMIATSMKEHPIGLLGMLFVGPFFVFHYGMFCFVHGIFVATFAEVSIGDNTDPGFPSPVGLINEALGSGANMPAFIWAIIILQICLFFRDFILRGEFRKTSVDKEMMAPYGRVIVLHIAIFAGAFAMIALGEPLWGVLGLIGLRVLWGMFLTAQRRLRLDSQLQQKVDVPSSI